MHPIKTMLMLYFVINWTNGAVRSETQKDRSFHKVDRFRCWSFRAFPVCFMGCGQHIYLFFFAWSSSNILAASRFVTFTFHLNSSVACWITKARSWLTLATATLTPEWQPPSPATSGRPTTRTATRPSTRTSSNSYSWTVWYDLLIFLTFPLSSYYLHSPWLL